MTLRRFSSEKKFFGGTVRIYSEGNPNVTSGGAAAFPQNDTTVISVAKRVIAFAYHSVIAAWRLKAESRRVEASAFYRGQRLKAQAEIFYGLFYGRAKFCCKTMQFCATRRESEITNYLASATIRKAVKRCAIR